MEAGLQAIGLSAKVIATLDRWTGLLQSAVLVAHSSYDPGVQSGLLLRLWDALPVAVCQVPPCRFTVPAAVPGLPLDAPYDS